jgi:tripartite-type tricarboxylate transporter receptor subunit TctC
MRLYFVRALMTAAIVTATVASASAQSVADFYKSKNIDLYIGYSVGGAYDLYARMLARHMGKHIPGNPNVIPKNMEGAATSSHGSAAPTMR